jgi:hypothetical protein
MADERTELIEAGLTNLESPGETCHIHSMTIQKTYIITITSPDGETVTLPIRAANEQYAIIEAGKIINRRVDELNRDSTIEITAVDGGTKVGSTSTVAEMTRKK